MVMHILNLEVWALLQSPPHPLTISEPITTISYNSWDNKNSLRIWKMYNSKHFPSPGFEKILGEKIEKNQKCSESSETPKIVIFSHIHILCIIMHILNFLVFFWCSLDQYLPPPKGFRLLSALVFGPGHRTDTTHTDTHTHGQTHSLKI